MVLFLRGHMQKDAAKAVLQLFEEGRHSHCGWLGFLEGWLKIGHRRTQTGVERAPFLHSSLETHKCVLPRAQEP